MRVGQLGLASCSSDIDVVIVVINGLAFLVPKVRLSSSGVYAYVVGYHYMYLDFTLVLAAAVCSNLQVETMAYVLLSTKSWSVTRYLYVGECRGLSRSTQIY